MCSFLEVWKADDQMETDPRNPDEQARPFVIFKDQTPTEERDNNLFGKTFNLSTDFVSLRQVPYKYDLYRLHTPNAGGLGFNPWSGN